MSKAWTRNLWQGPAGGEQGDRTAGGHQDHQEEQDRDRGGSGSNTTRNTDYVLCSTSKYHTYLRRYKILECSKVRILQTQVISSTFEFFF
jgi:hypothetical protein